jgi:hypothetical protein
MPCPQENKTKRPTEQRSKRAQEAQMAENKQGTNALVQNVRANLVAKRDFLINPFN